MKTRWLIALLTLVASGQSAADTTYQPFVLASINDAPLTAQAQATRDALTAAGFTIAGEYAPLENATVIVVTSDTLQSIAAKTARGGYAAGQRVSVTERDGRSEVAFVNPLYLQHAYRLDGDMQAVYDALSAALGNQEAFGAKDGLTAKKLAKYNYMIGMQKFDDPSELGRFDSHATSRAPSRSCSASA